MAKIDKLKKSSSLEVSPNFLKEQVKKIGIAKPQELLIETVECKITSNHVSRLHSVLKTSKEHSKWIRTNKNRCTANLPVSKVCTFCGETGHLDLVVT